MSKISGAIPSQKFEIIRDQIAVILGVELGAQAAITGDYDLDADVYADRNVPFDRTELPAVNVTVNQGDYSNKNQGQSDGQYTYNIEVYTAAKSSDGSRGDVLANQKLNRLMGVCRAILENPVYKTLDVTPGYIKRTAVTGFRNGRMQEQDGGYNVVSVMEFEVHAVEDTQLLEGVEFGEIVTQVKLGLTDKGYKYIDYGEGVFDSVFDETFA